MSFADQIIYGTDEAILQDIQSGVDLNKRDEYGFKPLHQAVICDRGNVVEWLLAAGADIEQLDIIGRTALQWASDRGNLPLCKYLLEQGANPNHSSIDGQPVLVNPILREELELVELLVQYGAKYQFANDFISAKLLGHRFELTGEADIVNPQGAFIPLSFEGFYLEFTCGLIQRSLNNFVNSIAGNKYQSQVPKFNKMLKALNNAAHLMEFQKQKDKTPFEGTIDNILANELLILPVGYQGHAITYIIYKNMIAKCDRGVNNFTDTVVIYEIGKPMLLNREFCYNLLYQAHPDEYIDYEMKHELGLKAITTLPTRSQIAGNCSWANVEASVPAMLFMLSVTQQMLKSRKTVALKKTITSFYTKWVEWDKDSALQEAVSDFLQADDSRRISKAMIMGSILTQRCHVSRKRDLPRARNILKILSHPNYQFLLKNYIKVYSKPLTGKVGKDLLKLFKKCGLDFDTLAMEGVKLPKVQQQGSNNKVKMTTALHVASLNGELDSIKYLIDKAKIDVDYQDRTGSTALMYAAWKGHFDIVKLLVDKYGANPVLANAKGGTASRYANYSGFKHISEYLREKSQSIQ